MKNAVGYVVKPLQDKKLRITLELGWHQYQQMRTFQEKTVASAAAPKRSLIMIEQDDTSHACLVLSYVQKK